MRNESIYISAEVRWYLRALAKAKCNGTKAEMTSDEMADCLLRETITTQWPELVVIRSEWEDAKQTSHKKYGAIEDRAIAAILGGSPVSVGDKQARTREET